MISQVRQEQEQKQLCGGPFFNGASSILGNTALNVDLTGSTGSSFQLPSGTYLSGGAGYNNTVTHVGSGINNSISVNISANAASGNVLNGAVIYGDGSQLVQIVHIQMLVQST